MRPGSGPRSNSRSNHCLIVAGPTCSGKSALAMGLARELGGVVVNADSMQVYRELRILNARPTPADEAAVPHRLYGVRAAAVPGSVAWWRDAALEAMAEAWTSGRLPILCGGTGMYLRALTHGLSVVPDPGAEARAEARGLLAEEGAAALHERLRMVDPDTAGGLRPSDGQRVARAWEVWRGTGQGMRAWTGKPGLPPAPCRFSAIRLSPPREALREAIGQRFGEMLQQGALAEVEALLAQGLPPSLPAMRAHGVPELAGVLRGTTTLEEASRRAVLLQGQYTKRQDTWFAHHALATPERTCVIGSRMADMTQQMERMVAKLLSFVVEGVDGRHADA